MTPLRHHLPGAALIVGIGIAIGLLLGLGAERPAATLPPPLPPAAAGSEPSGEEPAQPVPVPAEATEEPAPPAPVPAEATKEPAPHVPALDVANLPPTPAVVPTASPPSPETTSPGIPVAAAALAPPPRLVGPAWRRNAVAFSLPARAPMIAVVFDDLGMDRVHTAEVIRLPGPLTLSFLPYAGDLARQTAAGRAAGHELLVHMPMEPLASGLDPGPGALLVRLPPDEIMRRLDRGLAAFTGYVGINNHMGSRFTSDRTLMIPVLTELKRRGLLFLDSMTAPGSAGAAVAASLHLPHTKRNVFLDDELTMGAIRANLGRLEEIARRTGAAVAIGHPHQLTLEVVTPWLAGLAARGFVLAPLSAVVRAQGYDKDERTVP